METEDQDKRKKISKHEFFFETPLYLNIKVEDLDGGFNVFFSGSVDAYSPMGIDTTYGILIEEMRRYLKYEGQGHHLDKFEDFFAATLICKRKGDVLRFIIFTDGEIVVKIGQTPSLADLQYAEIGKKYDKILPEQDLRDLKKAIGLSAHGAGAGSLVYLRRIFENIILETYTKNQKILGISESDFKKKRMDEKVVVLTSFLPDQLVEMKSSYAVLSKGIHELSEEECLAYFPVLKLSLELILDQKIENEMKSKRDSSVKKELANIVKKLQSS